MSPAATTALTAEQTGRRVEEVLDRLARTGDREVCAAAEELVRVLMDFYGAGLTRIVRSLDGGPPPAVLGDELTAGLLVLHDLHPEDTMTRVGRALKAAGGGVEVERLDPATGALRLRPPAGGGGGCGCPSTQQANQQAVQDALSCFAPEVTSVDWAEPGATEPALLQISSRPPARAATPGPAPAQTS